MTHRKDGRWQEALTINGKRKFFYGKSKAEVLRKINAYKEEEATGKLFKDVASEWDKEHEAEYSYNAHVVYNKPYRECNAEFGDKPIKNITTQEIDLFIKRISAQQYAKRTVKLYLSYLSLVFKFGLRNGYCNYNPTAAVSVSSKLKTTPRELPPEEDIEKIKKGVNCTFGLFAYFLLFTGMRRGEALAIKMEDIDFENKLIHVNKSLYWEGNKPKIKETKTKAGTRTIVLLDALSNVLPHKKGYLFGDSKPLTCAEFRVHWGKYVNESGISSTPHQLRHLYATILYECGIDERITQELMGHSSINITRNIYTHIREKRLKETAEKLNAIIRI